MGGAKKHHITILDFNGLAAYHSFLDTDAL